MQQTAVQQLRVVQDHQVEPVDQAALEDLVVSQQTAVQQQTAVPDHQVELEDQAALVH